MKLSQSFILAWRYHVKIRRLFAPERRKSTLLLESLLSQPTERRVGNYTASGGIILQPDVTSVVRFLKVSFTMVMFTWFLLNSNDSEEWRLLVLGSYRLIVTSTWSVSWLAPRAFDPLHQASFGPKARISRFRVLVPSGLACASERRDSSRSTDHKKRHN